MAGFGGADAGGGLLVEVGLHGHRLTGVPEHGEVPIHEGALQLPLQDRIDQIEEGEPGTVAPIAEVAVIAVEVAVRGWAG